MTEGYAPEAVVNYLCLLGWSPKNNREKMAIAEVVELFDLPQILRHNARFDLTKLTWLNGEYIRDMQNDRFYELSLHALNAAGLDTHKFDPTYVKAALDTCKGKFKLFGELPAYAGFYFKEEVTWSAEDAQREFTPENKSRLQKLREALAALEPFDHEQIGATLAGVAKSLGIKTGQLVHPTRLACCGAPSGPSLYHLIQILGKTRSLQRIDRALAL